MRSLQLVAIAGLAGYAIGKGQPRVPDRIVRGVRRPMDAVGFLAYATMVGGRPPEREVLSAVSKEMLSGSTTVGAPAPEDLPAPRPVRTLPLRRASIPERHLVEV